jgi:hypothetical protein
LPAEFLIFGATLAGVALFHRQALAIAIVGLAFVIAFSGWSLFPAGGAQGPGRAARALSCCSRTCSCCWSASLLAAHFEKKRA